VSGKIKIVGLGPGGEEYLTLRAYDVITGAEKIYARTMKHPIIKFFLDKDVQFESFDSYYDEKETFEEVYLGIAEEILRLSETEDVVYAVPGNPFVAEKTVELIMEKAKESEEISIDIVHGASFIDAIVTTLKRDPVNGLKIIDGLELNDFTPDPTMDNLLIQVYNNEVASEVKLQLMNVYDDEDEVIIVRAAGIPNEERIDTVPLHEMDMIDAYDHLTSIYLPKIDPKKRTRFFAEDLVKLMNKLRSIDGCPWDREQTHESLKKYLLEEAYEVIEAIDHDDLWALEDELGDVLLQVAFHSEIASENGYFNFTDVITGIYEKMVRRHPHVFGDVDVESTDEVLVNWDEIKKQEKKADSYTEMMKDISMSFPALIRSEKIQKKAAAVGFDWDNIEQPIAKVEEELEELVEIVQKGVVEKPSEELILEVGDLLFAVVNVARKLGVSAEIALQKTVEKFINRFSYIEESNDAKQRGIGNLTLEEMDFLWEEAKKHEKYTKNQKNDL